MIQKNRVSEARKRDKKSLYWSMDKLKNTTIKSISSKILAGSFGNAKYFGYKDKKLISLVEIKTKNGLVAY